LRQLNSKTQNMKKIVCALSLCLALISCSGDDSVANVENPSATGIHLIKTIETSDAGSVTTVYTYNGDKVTGYTDSDGYRMVFTYTGDLMTKWEEYDEDDVLSGVDTFTYNEQGQLVKHIYDFEGYKDKYEYTHNADGTISVKHFTTGLNSDVYTFSHDGKIYDNKVEENVAAAGDIPAHIDTHTYTYDNKNNPMVNVTGFDKIAFLGDRSAKNFANNETSNTHTNSRGLVQPMTTTAYTYNAANFPLTEIETNVDSPNPEINSSRQYFYE